MKKLFPAVLLAAALLAPALASASAGIAVMKTYHGEGVAPDQRIAHDYAREHAWSQATAEGHGRCVEVRVFIAQTDEGFHVTSVQQCARL